MREISIDVTRLLGRLMKGRLPTGVDRVSLAYVRHFGERSRAVVRLGGRSLVLSSRASSSLFEQLLEPSGGSSSQLAWRLIKGALHGPGRNAISGRFHFNTGHSGLERASYAAHLRRLGVRPLFLVHDLIPITHPEYCRRGEMDKHIARMKTVLRLGHGIITNSRATLDELAQFARTSGKAMPPAVAAQLASAELPPPAPERLIDEPYFVALGTIEPRKNHWMLLQVWRRLVERHGERAPKLVVIGQRGWECENVIDLLERCEVLRGTVIELPRCSDTDLATYLHHAQALLFPSFAEGYGMPLVEALSMRVPVIASDLSAFREIAGSVPDYLDPLDGLGWMELIERYTNSDSSERLAQLGRINDFVSPKWSRHFELVEELMERLG